MCSSRGGGGGGRMCWRMKAAAASCCGLPALEGQEMTRWPGLPHLKHSRGASYCDRKVANREIKVWHFVIENGY
jgi:hypothetical protein